MNHEIYFIYADLRWDKRRTDRQFSFYSCQGYQCIPLQFFMIVLQYSGHVLMLNGTKKKEVLMLNETKKKEVFQVYL